MYAVIDIGSNTMRLSIYHYEDGKFNIMIHKKEMAGLAGYVEHGMLSVEGIQKACEVLISFRKITDHFSRIEVFAFATASFRNVDNTREILETISMKTGYQVEVLSGKEEAKLDFRGMLFDVSQKEGLVVDIGGGSTELVLFKKNKMLYADSLNFGSLSLYKECVSQILPKKKEIEEIKQIITDSLGGIQQIGTIVLDAYGELEHSEQKVDTICGVGGTIRATLKLCNYIYHKDSNNRIITKKEFDKIYEDLIDKKWMNYKIVLKICPDRIHTIIPGLIIMKTIMEQWKIKKIIVSNYGVREGYLMHAINKKNNITT